MKAFKSWTMVAVFALVASLGFWQAGDTVAIGFCDFETDCDALCYCYGHSDGEIVPAYCCPGTPCFGNQPP